MFVFTPYQRRGAVAASVLYETIILDATIHKKVAMLVSTFKKLKQSYQFQVWNY